MSLCGLENGDGTCLFPRDRIPCSDSLADNSWVAIDPAPAWKQPFTEETYRMPMNTEMTTYKKKMRVRVTKSMSIVKAWDIIGPIVAEQIGGPEYSHIPYLVDTRAYQIGHIFVQQPSEVQCFCAAPMLEVLGPLQDFIRKGNIDDIWLSKDLNAIKTTEDHLNFLVEAENGKNVVQFRAYDYFFLDKGSDTSAKGQVTIDRSSHEDLSRVEWFGLITGVIAADSWDLIVKKNQRERMFYVGDNRNTVLFKFEICKIDDSGNVHETSTEKMECRWLPVQQRDLDILPLTEFRSQSQTDVSRTKPCADC